MADSDPNAHLKQKEARAKAETAVVGAQTDPLRAQAEPAATGKPTDPAVVAITAEKARLDALKGLWESSKALSEAKKSADLAAAQAAIGTIPGSGIEGTITIKPDAGKGEATLLASHAIGTAACHIAKSVMKVVQGNRVVLLQGTESLQFPNYRQFLLQEALLGRIFDEACKEADRLSAEAQDLETGRPADVVPADVVPGMGAVPPLTAAGVVIDTVAKLGSYFMTNYEAGGISLTADTEQLVSATAEWLLRTCQASAVILPGRQIPHSSEFVGVITRMAGLAGTADSKANALNAAAHKAKDRGESETNASRKQNLQNAAALYSQAATLLQKAVPKAQEFIASLGVGDAKGIIPLTKITQEKVVCDELNKDNSFALVLDVRSTIGGYYTKKNLWTFFGQMPFYAMGGAIVIFHLVDRHGVVKEAGLIPIHSGYSDVASVQKLMTRGVTSKS